MNDSIVEVENLVTHYGETLVLQDVSLAVKRGSISVIIGGSGCGKTTLLKHMTGLIQPTSGRITFEGEDITKMNETALARVQQRIGIAFQEGALFNSMTVGENVALPMREYGDVDEKLIPSLVRLKLSLVGLAHAEGQLPSELSGGMKKRAGLARAIALDPPVIYFDEPSAGLDPIMAAGLDELILDLRKLLGITFIIVTHELDSIRAIADDVLMLDRGKVIFSGPMADADRSTHKRVKQFFDREADTHIGQRTIDQGATAARKV
jgi:phospholipid/cholesterol/gamma-HCH transport system ATP-binding protein